MRQPLSAVGGHCGHCAGIICHSHACVVIVRAVRSLHSHCTVIARACLSHYLQCAMLHCIICRAAAIICHGRACVVIMVIALVLSCVVIERVVRSLSGQCGARSSQYLPCAMLHCIICRAAAIICRGRACAAIVVIARALSTILRQV